MIKIIKKITLKDKKITCYHFLSSRHFLMTFKSKHIFDYNILTFYSPQIKSTLSLSLSQPTRWANKADSDSLCFEITRASWLIPSSR